ncbi:MAG: hypothetical protein KJ070_11690 [Verrucomicrobia bacterium]|nr:hypothetical protein [Verrucomicrobiota bacterium]
MKPQNVISHRMFVAALTHEASQTRPSLEQNTAAPASPVRSPATRANHAPPLTGVVAQQLLLLADGSEWLPVRT